MKNLRNNGIILYSIAGILLGLLIVSLALVVNYQNGFDGYFYQMFNYSHDFFIIASLPFVLGILFCYIGLKREKYFLLNQQVTIYLKQEKLMHYESKNKLETALKVARIGSWEIDYLNNKSYISDELRRIYDLPMEGPISNEALYKNVVAEDLDLLNQMTALAANGSQQVEFEYRYMIKGEVNHMISNICPRKDEAGNLISLFGTVQNITYKKRTELALKKSEEEKAVVLNNTQTLICLHDLDGKILDVNEAGEKMSGYKKANLIGQNISFLIAPDYRNLFTDYLEEFKTSTTTKGTLQVVTGTGEKRIWLYQNTLYHNNGANPYVIASAIDITESILAKNEIEKQQLITRQIIENSPNVIFVVDEQDQIVLANKNFSNFYNYNEKSTPSVKMLCKGNDDIFLGDAGLISTMQDGEILRGEGKLQNIRDNHEHCFIIIKRCFKEKNGKKYLLGFGMDITQRYQIETDLKAANEIVERSLKVKSQFLANMSHEIRTPLNAVIGFTDLLSETPLNFDQSEYVEIVKTASQNLLALINNILDMSKIESGTITLESLPIDIKQIITDIRKILEPKAKTKGIEIITNFPNNIPEKVIGDQLRLSQIMFNLLGNAVKFTDKGKITITCKMVQGSDAQKHYISFSVKDTGIGIPVDKHNDIFERFTQANIDTQRLYGGSGLGLSIVKSIVDMQGGTLSVESKEGEGTMFHFILTFKKYEETQNLTEIKSPDGARILSINAQKPIQVLLAEDNVINAMLATKVLSQKGFDVKHVSNGKLAVEAVQQNRYDVVLMDIQMPELNGIGATMEIRKLNSPVSKIPIIAMTAHSLHGEIQNCYNAGMNGYLAKPFKPEDLFSAIIDALNGEDKNDFNHLNPVALSKVS